MLCVEWFVGMSLHSPYIHTNINAYISGTNGCNSCCCEIIVVSRVLSAG